MLDWQQDVRPVLVAVYEAQMSEEAKDIRGPLTNQARINEKLGRPADDNRLDLAMDTLAEADYIEAARKPGDWLMVKVLERGLQEVAGWPKPGADTYDLTLAAIDRLIDEAPNADERGRLEKLRDGVVGVGRDVLVNVLSRAATGGL
jgi:hypothetical protein